MKFLILTVILLLYPTIGFSTEDMLQGEWRQDCKQVGEHYMTSRLAFIGNKVIGSSKWYSDSDCSKPEGEGWNLSKFQVIEETLQTKGTFKIKKELIDGFLSCTQTLQTYSIKESAGEKFLHAGTKIIYSACQNGPKKRVVTWEEEDSRTWHFHSPLTNISVEEYTNSLRRGLFRNGYWYELKKKSKQTGDNPRRHWNEAKKNLKQTGDNPLQGEWKKSCHQIRENYFTARRAYIGNKFVISWKKYSDSDCSELELEHWFLKKFQVVGESSKGALEIDMELIDDGGGKECPYVFHTVLITEEEGKKLLYTRPKPIDSPCQDGPEQRFMIPEEDPVIWHFHAPLTNVSVEAYTHLLNRGFSHFGYWYEQEKETSQ